MACLSVCDSTILQIGVRRHPPLVFFIQLSKSLASVLCRTLNKAKDFIVSCQTLFRYRIFIALFKELRHLPTSKQHELPKFVTTTDSFFSPDFN